MLLLLLLLLLLQLYALYVNVPATSRGYLRNHRA